MSKDLLHLRKPPGPGWQPGQSGNPAGRPLGGRNKLCEAFLVKLHEAFQKHGEQAIEYVATKKPLEFCRIIAYLLPKQFQVRSEGALANISDELLDEVIKSAEAARVGRIIRSSSTGEAAPVSNDKLN
jgi:hypothetical protein